jgi:hypothetical protein
MPVAAAQQTTTGTMAPAYGYDTLSLVKKSFLWSSATAGS